MRRPLPRLTCTAGGCTAFSAPTPCLSFCWGGIAAIIRLPAVEQITAAAADVEEAEEAEEAAAGMPLPRRTPRLPAARAPALSSGKETTAGVRAGPCNGWL